MQERQTEFYTRFHYPREFLQALEPHNVSWEPIHSHDLPDHRQDEEKSASSGQ